MEQTYLFLFFGIIGSIATIFGIVRILESRKNHH